MSIRFNFLIGFMLAGILFCTGDSGCPNEPVTPLPTTPKPATECPNMPVTPSPTKAPAQLVTASTTVAPHIPVSTECPNMPITPSPTNPPAQLMASSTTERSNIPITPSPTKSPDGPLAASTTIAPGSENQLTGPPMHCGSFPINATYSNQPGYICMLSPCCLQLCCQGGYTTGREITTIPPPTSTSSAAPPEALIICPPGTVLMGRRCHLLYCPQGSQMINDRCIVIECPAGTVWTGHRCSVPEPIVQNIKFQSTILTQLNQTRPQIVLNNTNNIFVNASLSLHFDDSQYKNDCNNENSDCNEETHEETQEETLPAPSYSNCCEIRTPRICRKYNNRWRCYSRRSRKCGEFCSAPIIYLRPSRIHATPKYLVMPPIQNDCPSYENCGQRMGGYNCSGCAFNDMDHCSYYCYRYVCPPRKCDYYDQEKYCTNNVGAYGCQEEDGCYGNWCL